MDTLLTRKQKLINNTGRYILTLLLPKRLCDSLDNYGKIEGLFNQNRKIHPSLAASFF
jgi:hypothetical protein